METRDAHSPESSYVGSLFLFGGIETLPMPVPINGQVFCYHRNHKGGVYDFLRPARFFRYFVDYYCKRMFTAIYF